MARIITNTSQVFDGSTLPPNDFFSNPVITQINDQPSTLPCCSELIFDLPYCYCNSTYSCHRRNCFCKHCSFSRCDCFNFRFPRNCCNRNCFRFRNHCNERHCFRCNRCCNKFDNCNMKNPWF